MNRRTAIKTIGASAGALLMDTPLFSQDGKQRIINQAHAEFPILMPDDLDEMNLAAWRLELAEPDAGSNPLLEPAMPWDGGGVMAHGTVLHDELDGLWKAWQVSTPPEAQLDGLKARHEQERSITYLESQDGVHWERPLFSSVSWPGHSKTNIILKADDEGAWQYASVLIHPDRKDWPYEMFVIRNSIKGASRKVVGLPPPTLQRWAHYRFRSKDGKSWEAVEGPLYIADNDVCFIYKEPGGGYSAYIKHYAPVPEGMRIIPYDNNSRHELRVIGLRTSIDGTVWSDEKVVLAPDWRDPNQLQFVEFTQHPARGGYIGIATNYDALTMTMNPQIFASRDGRSWWSPDRRTTLPNASLGDYGGGLIWQMKNLIRVGDRVYLYYGGTQGTHTEIFDTRFKPRLSARGESVLITKRGTLPFNAALCRASWVYGRMWALAPSAGGPTQGRAVTKPQVCAGRQLWLNAVVRSKGSLKMELLDANHDVVRGFSEADCSIIPSDSPNTQVRWKGGDRAPDRAVRLKFYLTQSFVYGFEWR